MWIILLDSFVHAVTFAGLGLLLWSVIQYGNFKVLNSLQRTINYVALGVLSIVIWMGVGFGFFYGFFGNDVTTALIPLIPLRSLIGLLLYLLIIQRFQYSFQHQQEIPAEIVDEEPVPEFKAAKPENEELLERIAVKSGTKIHVVLVPDIIYLQADGDYVQIVSKDGKYLKEQTMKFFEEHLPENQFVRVHRSTIVNVEMISRIELYEKQNQLLTLKNGQQIKTSPGGYKALRAALKL